MVIRSGSSDVKGGPTFKRPMVDVIGAPTDAEGGLFSEINDNSVAILLTYGTARILLAGDAEARKSTWRAVSTLIL